jgi:hypothetical protein
MLDLYLATDQTDRLGLALAAAGLALSADSVDAAQATRLRGALATLRQSVESRVSAQDEELERRFEQPLTDALAPEDYETEMAAGAEMSLEEAIELARSLAGS